MEWRNECLTACIKEADFWEMTWGETVREYDAYMRRRKDLAYFSYNTALAVGGFVASMFSSRQPPTINEIYPELFPKEEEDEEAVEEARMSQSEANFINFANAFNKRYENGNRKSEGENNG